MTTGRVGLIFLYLLALFVIARCTAGDDLVYETVPSAPDAYEFEILDILGLADRPHQMPHPFAKRNSASKFLLEVYNEIVEEEGGDSSKGDVKVDHIVRHRRALHDSENFITKLDLLEIQNCNNIITFSGKASAEPLAKTTLQFNTRDVPRELRLVHSALRLYQDPSLGDYATASPQPITISLYQRIQRGLNHEYRIITSLNATTFYRGWLEFNTTRLLNKWLDYRPHQAEILVNVTRQAATPESASGSVEIAPRSVGIVFQTEGDQLLDLQPFIIGYFNGPDLMLKVQKLRFKRDVVERKRRADIHAYRRPPPPPVQQIYKLPKNCERLNFTLDFRDLHMHNWVIAPKKFEAFFCGGECNFPLGAKMNATNHAIVQTLMHLKRPNLPKPCCVPTVLGAISILHYLNEDSVNLSKYPQSVARECGCH